MKQSLLLLLAGLLAGAPAIAQRTCGTTDYMQHLEEKNPKLKVVRSEIRERMATWEMNSANSRQSRNVVTIPVVFHVVYANAAENVSDTRLMQQLQVLNSDYRKLNADVTQTPAIYAGLAADTEIEFCLAQRDPQGNPTTGITRTPTGDSSFDLDDQVKSTAQGGKDPWDPSRYLNIWVCDLGSFLLGYATQPGTPAVYDGVVLGYFTLPGSGFPPFDKGRTATHEVGHYLDLEHIWGPGNGGNCASDFVADTLTQNEPNYDCPSFPSPSCNNQGDMHMNYMDYVNDACMFMFTAGQKTRMLAGINVGRPGLLTSMGCVPVNLPALDAALTSIATPASSVAAGSLTPEVVLKNSGANTLTSATINYTINGGTSVTYQWSGNLASQATTNVTLPATTVTTGTHTITVTTTAPNGGTDANTTNNSASRTFTVTSSSGLAQSFEGGTFPPSNYQLSGSDGNYNWQHTTSAARTGTSSIYVDNFDISAPGARADISLPNINLSAFASASLSFDVAHKMYSQSTSNPDSLEVLISTNGGQSYTSIYKKGGASLATGTAPLAITGEFVPTSASDWRKETINLSQYLFSTSTIIKIRAINRYGNNLYIDDILIDGVAGTDVNEAPAAQQVSLYPNPSTGQLTLVVNQANASATANLEVTDMVGRKVATKTGLTLSADGTKIDLSSLTEGVYLARITTGNQSIIKRFVISK